VPQFRKHLLGSGLADVLQPAGAAGNDFPFFKLKPVSAMAYVMGPGFLYGAPSESYLNCIREGYASSGFDTAVLDEAVEYSTEHLRRVYELPDDNQQQKM